MFLSLLFAVSLKSVNPARTTSVIDPHVQFGMYITFQDPYSNPITEISRELKTPCDIASWNNETFNSVPYSSLHNKWAKLRKQDFPNLSEAQLRVLSAFVYQHEIVVTTTAMNRYGKPVYCRYFDCNRDELNGTAYETIMFPLSAAFCARRAGAMYMSLTDSPNGPIISEPVPLVQRVSETYSHELSVCVGPVYGTNETKWLEIVETTEHHLLMGINYFYFTIFDRLSDYARKLVDEYERLGYYDVTVIQNEYEVMDWMSHLIQINDCHFRSRYHSKWVLNLDIDERLVMLKYPLLPFLRSLSPNVGEVMITTRRVKKTSLLPKKYIGKERLLMDLEYLKYNRTMNRTQWEVPKMAFRPEKVQALFYHWSFAQYPGTRVISLPKTHAYVRHYRTTMKSLLGVWHFKQGFETTRMDPELEDKVTEAVTKRLETVYNQRKIRCEEVRQNLIGHFSKENYDCVWKNGKTYRESPDGS